jgi:SAM-dependent methyltransferase
MKNLFPSKIKPGLRLNLGCGDKILEGYVNVDVVQSRKGVTPDLIADLRNIPLDPGTADEVLAVHVIEHFYLWEARQLIAHWRDLLKPGGVIVIECPNILTAAHELINDESLASDITGKRGQLVMWSLYGDPGWEDPLMCHKWGYTPSALIQLLSECKFRSVRQEPAKFKKKDPRDMRIVGVR